MFPPIDPPLSHHLSLAIILWIGVDRSPSNMMRPQAGVPANSPVKPSTGSQLHVNESLQMIAVFIFQTPFLTLSGTWTSYPTESCPNWSFVSKVTVATVLSSKFWSNLLHGGSPCKVIRRILCIECPELFLICRYFSWGHSTSLKKNSPISQRIYAWLSEFRGQSWKRDQTFTYSLHF